MNVRLQAVEKATGEHLLEIQHRQRSQGEAIAELRSDMHRLVELNERQLILQQQQAESSKALDRAFTALKDLRSDTNDMIRQMASDWTKWRDAHEAENRNTSSFATQARGGLRVLGVLGVVLWGLLGGIAWDWRDTLKSDQDSMKSDFAEFKRATNLRFEAQSSAIQENRLRLAEELKREAHP
jgi:hypothetical protein